MKALLEKVPEIATRADKKGQTALHIVAKGQRVDIINELIVADNVLFNMVDKKNIAFHIATRKRQKEDPPLSSDLKGETFCALLGTHNMLYFRYLDLFVVTFILSKVARTSIAQVLTVISQTQKFALREASRTRSVCLLICALRKPKLFEDVLQSIK
ncbi:uncharacterized protein [Rutidosis leptorrhynchoides]